MPTSIADLFVDVSADVSGALTGLNQVGAAADNLSNQFRAAVPAALLLEGGAVAIGAAFSSAINVAASFEQAMANVRAVMSPAEATQFGGALGDLAVTLGQQTVFSAREAAAGIGELIKAGISAPDVLNGAGAAALNLAAATGISVANAATIAAQTMNAFHKSASDLTGVVDTLAGVANATAADMTDLQFGLQVVSATAQTMGLSFEDTATAIGVFVSAGETGATAGTGLRQMLLELIPTTKPAKDEMAKLGLVTADGGNAFFDAAGHVKSLAQISQVLQNALRGMSDEQRIAALNTLFTRDAINSATILANQGAKGINAYTKEVQGISAADTAATRLGTLQGALNNLGSSFETVQIIVGNLFLPTITRIANQIRGVVDQFSNLSPEMQRAIVIFTGVSGAIAGLLGATVLLSPFIRALGPSFGALVSVLLRLSPVFLALSALATGLFIAWQTNFLGIRDIAQRAFDALPGILDNVGQAVSKLSGQLLSGDIGGALDTFRSIIIATVPGAAGFVDLIGRIADGVGRFAGNIGAGLLTFFTVTLPPIVDTISQFSGDVGTAMLDFFNNTVAPIADTVGRFAGDVGAGLTTFFTQTLPPVLAQIGGFTGDIGSALLTFFRDNLPVVADTAGRFVGNIGEGLTTFFTVTLPPILDQMGKFTADVTSPVIQFFSEHLPAVVDSLGKFTGDIGAGMVKFFTVDLPPVVASAALVTGDTFAALVDFFETKGPLIVAGVQKFAGAQTQPLTDFFAQFDAIKTQVESLGPLFGAIGNFATSLDNLQLAIGNLLARSFGSALKPEFELFGNTLRLFADTVAPAQPVLDAVGATVETLGQRLSGATDFINNAAAAIQRLADALNAVPADKLPGAGGANGLGLNPDLFNGNVNPNTPIFKQTSFTPGGGGGGAPVVVNFNAPVDINGAGDLADFLNEMSARILAATRRGSPSIDNSGVPTLQTTTV